MRRYAMVVLSLLLIAGFSPLSYAGKGDQTQDRIQARDGTGTYADCPCCDGDPLDAAMDQDQIQARDGTGANCTCPTGGVCDGTGPHGATAGR